ncbi:MAG TPA: hypothetical protein VF441_10150 [Acidimicrobiia bacterium]
MAAGRGSVARHPEWVIARFITRRASLQATLWGAVFGIVVFSSMTGFVTAYPTAADRVRVKTLLGANVGVQALLGPARRIDTVAGFTAWRALGLVMLMGAVWGLLVGTRFFRGEEEAGRWEFLVAGQTTRGRAAAQTAMGLGVCIFLQLCATAVIVVLVGLSGDARFGVRASLFLAVALVSSSAVFVAVGAVTAQLAPTRRRAASLAAGVFGVAFVLRLVGTAVSGLRWLRWASPLGWIDELHPLTGSQPAALIPIATFVAVLLGVAVLLAGSRDLGASVLPDHDRAVAHTALLHGHVGLATRLSRGVGLGWLAGIGAMGLLLGLVAKTAAKSIEGSAAIRQILARLGGHRLGAEAYLGFAFLIVATLVALVAASQVNATREEEADGRLDNLLVRRVRRSRWLVARIAIALMLIVLCALAAGVLSWVGAASQHSGLSFIRLVEAGLNLAPPAVLVLGIGTLVHGVRPRLTAIAVYGVVAWSFLVELVGGAVRLNHWLLDTSVLFHITPAPATDPNTTSAIVLVSLGALAALIGMIAFDRRDIATA